MPLVALATLLAAWPPVLSPPSAPASDVSTVPASVAAPVGFYFPPEELQRVLPREAVTRVGLMADHAVDAAAAVAAFTAAAREAGLQVVPLMVRREPLEELAPLLSDEYQLDAVAALQMGQSGERAAAVEVWSKSAVSLGTLTTRPPPTAEESARARADVEYARRHLSVDGSQQFQGQSKTPLSRGEFYRLVGRGDLARQEQNTSIARGVLIGTGATVGSVGLVLEVLQLIFVSVATPIEVTGCEVGRALNRNSSVPPDPTPCSGPEMSPIPLVIALGGGALAAGGAAIRSDAASAEEREELARGYNLRLRENLGGSPKAGSVASPAVTLRVSAALAPEAGMVVLQGRF